MSVYRPQHLTEAEVDAVLTSLLKELEAMHLRASVKARVIGAFGPNAWDPETGPDIIAAVRQEWRDCKRQEETEG